MDSLGAILLLDEATSALDAKSESLGHIDLRLVDGQWGERRMELSIWSILFSFAVQITFSKGVISLRLYRICTTLCFVVVIGFQTMCYCLLCVAVLASLGICF